MADQLADLTPQVKASSGQEWQYEISTVRLILTYQLAYHLMVKNGNLTFLLLEPILADQLADLNLWYMHLVVKNGNMRFLL